MASPKLNVEFSEVLSKFKYFLTQFQPNLTPTYQKKQSVLGLTGSFNKHIVYDFNQ